MESVGLQEKLGDLSVLIVDDNAAMRGILRTVLTAMGLRSISESGDATTAMQLLQQTPVDLLICDWKMQPIDGIALVRWLRDPAVSPAPELPILMLTCYTDRARVCEARDAGVTEFMAKPFSPEGLYQRIRAIVEQPRPFVQAKAFFGPDRRRKSVHHDRTDRRSAGAAR